MDRTTNELGHLAQKMLTPRVVCTAMRGKRLAALHDACHRLAQRCHVPSKELLVALNNSALGVA